MFLSVRNDQIQTIQQTKKQQRSLKESQLIHSHPTVQTDLELQLRYFTSILFFFRSKDWRFYFLFLFCCISRVERLKPADGPGSMLCTLVSSIKVTVERAKPKLINTFQEDTKTLLSAAFLKVNLRPQILESTIALPTCSYGKCSGLSSSSSNTVKTLNQNPSGSFSSDCSAPHEGASALFDQVRKIQVFSERPADD